MKNENILTDEEWNLLNEAARKSGKPRRQLLRELLAPLLSGRLQTQDDAKSQKERRQQAFARIDALACPEPLDDGVCASIDHDKIIYGGK